MNRNFGFTIHKRVCVSQTIHKPHASQAGGAAAEKQQKGHIDEPIHRDARRDRIRQAAGAPGPHSCGRDTASYDRPLRLVFAAVTGKMDVRAFSHQGIA
ncbi:MAG TPA: hypothetical protein DDZ51_06325 [Planctomycetaceae bacterium]|nr:hypothetical protein [Planctomycetaceae bacterium]